MSNEINSALAALLAPTAAAEAPKADRRPPSVLWLNIGVQVGETFVTLPFGLPLDDMKPIEAKGKNAEWHNLAAAKNALLKMLQEAGGKMDSGTEQIIPSLQVQLLRKSDGVVEGSTDAATNPILAGLVTALSK